jgi:hypothetical protein
VVTTPAVDDKRASPLTDLEAMREIIAGRSFGAMKMPVRLHPFSGFCRLSHVPIPKAHFYTD